jgi:hypothetical protein
MTTKNVANFAWMRERAFCGMSSSMLLERFPEVQSLGPEINGDWSDLAQQVEGEAPNQNIAELLEKRFSDYFVDPSQGQPADEAFARLAEHKRRPANTRVENRSLQSDVSMLLRLAAEDATKISIARQLGIGEATVYRILALAQE